MSTLVDKVLVSSHFEFGSFLSSHHLLMYVRINFDQWKLEKPKVFLYFMSNSSSLIFSMNKSNFCCVSTRGIILSSKSKVSCVILYFCSIPYSLYCSFMLFMSCSLYRSAGSDYHVEEHLQFFHQNILFILEHS